MINEKNRQQVQAIEVGTCFAMNLNEGSAVSKAVRMARLLLKETAK